MGGVIGMTKEAMGPILGGGSDIGKAVTEGTKPDAAPAPDSWDCVCGQKGIRSKFCPECGKPKPAAKPADTWDCECGQKGIASKFCPECGRPRPAPKTPETWECPECGAKGITSKFCPECGHKRED